MWEMINFISFRLKRKSTSRLLPEQKPTSVVILGVNSHICDLKRPINAGSYLKLSEQHTLLSSSRTMPHNILYSTTQPAKLSPFCGLCLRLGDSVQHPSMTSLTWWCVFVVVQYYVDLHLSWKDDLLLYLQGVTLEWKSCLSLIRCWPLQKLCANVPCPISRRNECDLSASTDQRHHVLTRKSRLVGFQFTETPTFCCNGFTSGPVEKVLKRLLTIYTWLFEKSFLLNM